MAAPTPSLSPTGRFTRTVATLVGLILIVGGTVRGQDSDFPFAPFRMYAVRDDPNGGIRELRVQVVTSSGAVVDVTNAAGAPRRSELEGRIDELVTSPATLARIAPLYVGDIKDARTLQLVWRNHVLRDGRATSTEDTVIVSVPVQS